MNELISLNRKLNRLGFFYAFLVITIVIVAVQYLFKFAYPLNEIEPINYFLIKGILGLVYLILLMPIAIGRLNDIAMSRWWVLIGWISYPFTLNSIMVIKLTWGIDINPMSIPVLGINILFLLFILVLLFKAGSSNNAPHSDSLPLAGER